MKKSSLRKKREESSQVAEDPFIQGCVQAAEDGGNPRNRMQCLEKLASHSSLEQEQTIIEVSWKQYLTVQTF